MKSLSGLDATFLYLETPEMPMHVGSLNLYELPPGFKGSFYKAVFEHIGRRMHLAPIFSRKLAFMPFDLGHPLWVEADHVDLEYHLRKVKGVNLTVRQVEAMAARLHGQLIDRAHPLWEFYVFDSVRLDDGRKCAAFYSKVHHAALDGKGGMVLANAMLDVTPVPREVAPADPSRKGRTRGDLKIGEMIGAVFSNSLAQYAKIAKSLPAAASSLGGTMARQSLTGSGAKMRPKLPVSLAPKTVFNAAITPNRVFATASIPFGECRTMAKAVGGSFNDIVLWICSTALRTYLARHASIPKKPMIAAMPVSLREENNKELNNQASMSLVDLGTQYAHPVKRLNAIMASTGKVKDALVNLKSVLPTDYPSLLAPWIVGGVAKAAFKTYSATGLAERLPMMANLAISNVPGPQVPLYMAGAKMLTFHPLSIVTHGLALNITIQTYAGNVDFGVIADKKAVPHVQDLADAIVAAFEEARKLYAMTNAPVPAGATAAAPRVVTPARAVAKATRSKTPVSKVTRKAPASSTKAATVKTATTAAKTPNANGNQATRSAPSKAPARQPATPQRKPAAAKPRTARA
ncbi:MAG: wax ester/triacylglycerol synthase family O-acyltransferase [Burkholderiales bacterium]|nr:MAG: wax ester/triacylglycerol synthase family O-acyltransferase [Burkholderiales bacterium]